MASPFAKKPVATVGAPEGEQDGPTRVAAMLAPYGLEGMAPRAWTYFQTIAGSPTAEDEFVYWLREQPEYKQRFAGMEALRKKGRAISEGEYIAIEKQYVSLFRQAGLPAGFYDSPDDFASFIANEVSPQEMSGRLDVARVALYETPPEARDQLARLYGLGPGDVMAFLLDPTKALPIIQQQFTAAEAAAASKLSGFGLLTRQEAERVGLSGRNFAQLSEGFDQLARSTELFQPILGEQGETFSRGDQLDAAFGSDTAKARRLQRRAQERVAKFQGGGGWAQGRDGTTGLGSAAS